MFKNLTVRARLVTAFGGLAALVLVVAGISVASLSEANGRFVSYVEGVNARASLGADVRTAVDRRAIAARNLVLVNTPEDIAIEKAEVLQAHETVQSKLAELNRRITDDRDATDAGRALVAEISRVESAYGPVALAIVKLALDGKKDEATASIDKDCRPLLSRLIAATDNYKAYAEQRAQVLTKASAESYAAQRDVLIGACLAAFGAAALFGLLISRSLTRALGGEPGQLGQAAQRVAAGDLGTIAGAANAPAGSVLASLGAMQASLARIVCEVRDASNSIALGSSEIASGNADLSQRTEEQASALEETSATMTQLGATVLSNSDNAAQANQLALTATEVAARGGAVVGQVGATMKGINDSSRRIADILSVIDGIAFQTNILALNAAVEAARAGEQGRGFAVVAGEVRSLAQRSAEAAKEIKTLIADSVERVEQGTQLVDKAGATMGEVVGAIRRVSDIVGEISAAGVEQSTGVAQVGEAVTQMDRVTQQNAALVEESAAAAESLKLQAEHLVTAVAVFRLGEETALPRVAAPVRAAVRKASAPLRTLSMAGAGDCWEAF